MNDEKINSLKLFLRRCFQLFQPNFKVLAHHLIHVKKRTHNLYQ